MNNRITMIVAAALALVAFGAALVSMTGADDPVACTADARLDAPDGWVWLRDGSNDCAWTLYNADGDTAPDSVYESIDEAPPPAPPGDTFVMVAFAIGAVASVVAIISALRLRKGPGDPR